MFEKAFVSLKEIKERGRKADDVTVQPWPPVNIFWWSATETNYTSKCLEIFFHHKNTITTSNFYLN